MQDNVISEYDLDEYKKSRRPMIDTGREMIELKKHPDDLDFNRTVGGTTYIVSSRFDKNASESLLDIVLRWMDAGTDVSRK